MAVSLASLLQSRLLVLDSAMGTALQDADLAPDDFGGEAYDGCNEHLILTRPDVIEAIHVANLEAGADILETNTFGSTPLVLEEYGLQEQAATITRAAAELARSLADAHSTQDKPRFVAGSMGPTTKAISVTGGVTFSALQETFYLQAKALVAGGVDYLLLETCQDTRNIKAGLLAINRLAAELNRPVPVAVSGTIEAMGTMLAGQSVSALYASLMHAPLLYLGLNCATGPEFMTDHLRTMADWSRFPVACVPNAGLPDENGLYQESAESMGEVFARFGGAGWLNLMGGCCGTRPEHIAHFVELASSMTPRKPARKKASLLSGTDFLEITDELAPVIVGERTNVIGSRKFKRLIAEGALEEATDIARAQVRGGASIIDICLANPDRDEEADMEAFLSMAAPRLRAPLMIDSTNAAVIELALTHCQGKAIINSINLEDGLSRFEEVVPLARRYGAALVVGCIDDDPEHGMAVSRERKLEVAERSYKILTGDFGIEETDIYWDPLVFPCATGDAAYVGSAEETLEGIRLIKKRFPRTRTLLGISNVSFGLPPAGREVLNAVFLHHAVEAGLDLAIVNAEKLVRFSLIEPEVLELANDLLFGRGEDPVTIFANHFRDAKPKATVDRKSIPLDQRIGNCILEGTKEGLIEDLEEKRRNQAPIDIINGPLMAGMDEVGRLFNNNELIVAEVLQSAEVMKAAVSHLEQFMESTESATRGSMVLATVKGDVHDIGKNLVEMIFSNNGFRIHNLGIKVDPQTLIAAVKEHQPDLIGLSGLLVKSAQMMVTTAEDLTTAGIDCPMLVGGAALSERFTLTRIDEAYKGQAIYAKDAMRGLELAKEALSSLPALKISLAEKKDALLAAGTSPAAATRAEAPKVRSTAVSLVAAPPPPPDLDLHILRETPLEEIWRFLDYGILFRIHLGMKSGDAATLLSGMESDEALAALREKNPKLVSFCDTVRNTMDEYRDSPCLRPAALYRFYRCCSKGNRLQLFNESNEPIETFDFPRQTKPPHLCLSDYVNPGDTPADSLCLFVTTVGEGLREEAERLREKGELLKSHALSAIAIRTAEAYAEWLHTRIRNLWGAEENLSLRQIFRAEYTGQRFSFGYPACPGLEDQKKLWTLLQPEQIGCHLTEEMMMDPEASVSAIAFHHPQAAYFRV